MTETIFVQKTALTLHGVVMRHAGGLGWKEIVFIAEIFGEAISITLFRPGSVDSLNGGSTDAMKKAPVET